MREMEILSTSVHPEVGSGCGEAAASSDPSLASAIAVMQQRAAAAAAAAAAYYPYPANMTAAAASPLPHPQAVIPSQARQAGIPILFFTSPLTVTSVSYSDKL